ncbi:amidohydrolase family protein [Pelosinus sp. IPA-1]|uniref:amidohydrolase family protein n=1 Tax=Pelosinus sp. IPA-1 TaxID=3029569 RepID=UPI0024362841|nr:amidohydrolase family protein [Pelosinus sp. IPA-1]GMA99565.1 hypothetical protein PIPA1_23650 [Pelosinus sp. IPA-1]
MDSIGRSYGSNTLKYPIADAHLHYVDFTQNTEGVDKLINCMDSAGVTDCAMFGLPVTKIWGEYESKQPSSSMDAETRMYFDGKTDYIIASAYLNAHPDHQKRLHPFICGINGLDKNSLDHVKRLIQTYPGIWKGIGELFAYHDSISYMTAGDIPRPDSSAFMEIYDFAGRYGMPVLIHSNITSGKNPNPIYLERVMQAVKLNPQTNFIWAHIGISNTNNIPNLYKIISRELKENSNLNVDISWVIYDKHIRYGNKIKKDWVSVIEEHPDRFIIGTDVVGKFESRYVNAIKKYDILLEQLTSETTYNICYGNFMKLLPKTGIFLNEKDQIII